MSNVIESNVPPPTTTLLTAPPSHTLGPPVQQTFERPVVGTAVSPIREVEVSPAPLVAKLSLLLPFLWPTTCYCVSPNEEVAVITCGVLTGMRSEPGCYCDLPNMQRRVSVKMMTMPLPDSKVADVNGAPVIVSAVLNYRIVDAKKALFAVDDYNEFVRTNATAVLKHVVSTHAYEQLKSNTNDVNLALKQALQPEVTVAGVHIENMSMNELNYAPEIAGAMLKKQQAGALVEARELIVEGAVNIAQEAVRRLESGGNIKLSEQDKVKLVTNLLTVTCSDTDATPTVNVS
eukprot:TRINITY_DN6576_c0_g2_i1.p1 TRINITY_DN6576_c0_g2~~TRINITY_DN6576_c0_g2_i1.p1  ORF type:complete len:290 (-),score=49.87 TRINITY_DN6576_c0_g2_i1:199-1068(-)